MPYKVSILVCLFNKVEYTRRCVETIRRHTTIGAYQLVMVDNASSDGTAAYLAELASDPELGEHVVVVANSENLGFVGGNNSGLAAATGEHVLFLNNDTEVSEGWLETLLSRLEDDTVGIVGAKLVYPNGQLQEAGGIVFSDGSGWNYGRGQNPDHERFDFLREVDYVSGACLLVRGTLIRELGGFDTRYQPAYYEDTDLCFAARAAGLRVLYDHQCVITHHEGITAGTDTSAGMKRYQVENRAKFVSKWSSDLDRQYPPSPAVVRCASNRAPGPRVLVVDPLMAAYDKASGSKRLFEMLKLLALQRNQVTFIARNGGDDPKYARKLRTVGVEVYSGHPEKLEQLGQDVDDQPKLDFPRLLKETRYDLAILAFWYIAEQYLPDIRRFSPLTPVVVDSVDVHFVREQREAEMYGDDRMARQAQRTKRRELETYRQAEGVIFVTEADRDQIAHELPDQHLYVIPNIHEMPQTVHGIEGREGMLFVGNFGHTPNIDAVKWFTSDVLPIVQRRIPSAKLTVVGNKPSDEILALASPAVEVTGFVEDIEPYLHSARVSVAPLRYGAGLKGKVGESLSYGLPVVATSIAAEGMDSSDTTLARADEAEAFAEAIIHLYSDDVHWSELARNGREYVESRYSPNAVAAAIEDLVRSETAPDRDRDMVSIVVVCHSQLALTERCLESVIKHTPEPHEIVVVENGSDDGTAEWLQSWVTTYSDRCTIVLNDENRGFAAGANQGISLARGGYVMLLSNTAQLASSWVKTAREAFEATDSIGVVAASDVEMSGERAFRLDGAALLARREVIDRIGGLDERFSIGSDAEEDLCVRVHLCGYKTSTLRGSLVRQEDESQALGQKSQRQASRALFSDKWKLSGATDVSYPLPSPDPLDHSLVFLSLPDLGNDHLRVGSVWRQDADGMLGRWSSQRLEIWRSDWENVSALLESSDELLTALDTAGLPILRLTPELRGREEVVGVSMTAEPLFTPPTEGPFILYQGTDLAVVPQSWAEQILLKVDRLWTPSTYTKQAFVKAGVPEQLISVVPFGVDLGHFKPGEREPLLTGASFNFLFTGEQTWRHGFDLLLKAYAKAFTAEDDVCLIVRPSVSGLYPASPVQSEALERFLSRPNHPKLLMLKEVPRSRIVDLYRSCDVMVFPYRGETFGSQGLEALACGTPLIITQGGAADDWADESSAWLIPSSPAPANVHIPGLDTSAALLEPDFDRLIDALRDAVNPGVREAKAAQARACAKRVGTWDQATKVVLTDIGQLRGTVPVGHVLPATVEGQKSVLLAIVSSPLENGNWQPAVLSYVRAFSATDDVTLAIPCAEGKEQEAVEALVTMLEQHDVDLEQLADIIVVELDDTTSLELAADAVIDTGVTALRAKRCLDAGEAELQQLIAALGRKKPIAP